MMGDGTLTRIAELGSGASGQFLFMSTIIVATLVSPQNKSND
jgi:hypothetical protein